MASEAHKLREADGQLWDKHKQKIREGHTKIAEARCPGPLKMGEPKGTISARLLRIHQLQQELFKDQLDTDSSMRPGSNLMEDTKYSKVRHLLDRGYYEHYEAELREIRDGLRAEVLADIPRQRVVDFISRCRDATGEFLELDRDERQDALSCPKYAVCVEVLADVMRMEAQGEIFEVDELFPEPVEYERSSFTEKKSNDETLKRKRTETLDDDGEGFCGGTRTHTPYAKNGPGGEDDILEFAKDAITSLSANHTISPRAAASRHSHCTSDHCCAPSVF
jgi:hypothetical protein